MGTLRSLVLLLASSSVGADQIFVNGWACEPAVGFNKKMSDVGFWRASTMYIAESDWSIEPLLWQSDGEPSKILLRNRLALYRHKDGRWALYRAAKREIDASTSRTYVCEVETGIEIVVN